MQLGGASKLHMFLSCKGGREGGVRGAQPLQAPALDFATPCEIEGSHSGTPGWHVHLPFWIEGGYCIR